MPAWLPLALAAWMLAVLLTLRLLRCAAKADQAAERERARDATRTVYWLPPVAPELPRPTGREQRDRALR